MRGDMGRAISFGCYRKYQPVRLLPNSRQAIALGRGKNNSKHYRHRYSLRAPYPTGDRLGRVPTFPRERLVREFPGAPEITDVAQKP